TIRAGVPNDRLALRIQWTNRGDTSLNARLEIKSNDPNTPVASFGLAGIVLDEFERTIEGAFISMVAILSVIPPPIPQFREIASLSQSAPTNGSGVVTLNLEPNASQSLTTEIPAFLGGGSIQLTNFAGSATVSLLPIPADTNQAFIRVESGGFTAPSFRLPSGLETGPNRLTFGSPEQSEGILIKSTGNYTASAAATIVNSLIPGGVTVRGSYSGTYNSATRGLSLKSESRDLFQRSDRIVFIESPEGLWLTWASTSVLEKTGGILGPWETVQNSSSPYRVVETEKQQFFRLRGSNLLMR
ncbi:MAG TPA: hypothetical protein VK633_12975, partial [Verrucomicrobiae bacterium]|nr:hypothetical protein [Verrucomicrobiae bacterium]